MFERILVPLDRSAVAECVLPHVVALARIFHSQVTLVHVLNKEPEATIDPVLWQMSRAEAETYLNEVGQRLYQVGVNVGSQLLEGQPAQRIIESAHAQQANLIILSSHGQSGLSSWNVSSEVQKIIMRAKMSVMIVRAYQAAREELAGLAYRKLLVPLDGSVRAESVVPVAVSLVEAAPEAQALLAHVVQRIQIPCEDPVCDEDMDLSARLTERARQASATYLDRLVTRYGERFHAKVVVSDSVLVGLQALAEGELPGTADDVDLVLLCAHGSCASSRWPYGTVVVGFIVYGSSPLLILQDFAPEEIQLSKAEIASKEKKGY